MAAIALVFSLLPKNEAVTRLMVFMGIFAASFVGLILVACVVMFLWDYFHVSTNPPRKGANPSTNPVNLARKGAASFPVQIFLDKTRLAGTEAKCGICSSEFKSKEKINVLPRCNHGFHVKCVKGLASRSSCPVCGTNSRMLPENRPELDV